MGCHVFDHSHHAVIVAFLALLSVWVLPTVVDAQPESPDEPPPTLLKLEQQRQAYSLSRRGEMSLSVGQLEDLEVFLGLQTVGRAQALFQDDVVLEDDNGDDGAQPQQQRFIGLQTAWGNLRLLADYDERIEVFFDLYLASRPNPANTYGHEGFILIDRMPPWLDDTIIEPVFDYISVRGGQFEIDYGDHRYRRSDNARVQTNPLVGNYLVDPKTTEIGAELFADRRRFNWLVGVGSGTATENFAPGTGTSIWLKLWGYPFEWARLALSNYRVDHSDNPLGAPVADGASSNLFSGHRSGGAYAGVASGNNAPGQLLVGAGQDVLAHQLDLTIPQGSLEFYGHLGLHQDFNTTGSGQGTPTDRWLYRAVELVFEPYNRWYLAARYSGATALLLADERSGGTVDRVQLGSGFEFAPGLLVKAEYVAQWYFNFRTDDPPLQQIQPWHEPRFHGAVLEASYGF